VGRGHCSGGCWETWDRRYIEAFACPLSFFMFVGSARRKKEKIKKICSARPSRAQGIIRHTQDISSPSWSNGNGTENKRIFQIVIVRLAFTCAEEGAKRNGRHI
jgi:hypothetical protein